MTAHSRNRYITLDAMRGIAALFVVARHFSGLRGAADPQFSFLAVDLFFLLSGFVLSFSYDERIAAGMSPAAFLMKRIIRLYPLYFLGIALGIAIALSDTIRHRAGATGMGAFLVQSLTGLVIFAVPDMAFAPRHVSAADPGLVAVSGIHMWPIFSSPRSGGGHRRNRRLAGRGFGGDPHRNHSLLSVHRRRRPLE